MNLSQSHTAYLRSRGVTDPGVIGARGYKTVEEAQELISLGFSEAQAAHVPGLLLPIFNTTGEAQGYEYRADTPRQGKSGKVVKFDRPYGQVPCINVNPLVADTLRKGGPFQPLVIVEGVTRADALAEVGVASGAIMGIYGWKGDTGSGPQVLSELHELPIKGREVWIFPDGDATTKPGVNSGVRALVDVFRRRGARAVSIGVVPDGLGLDDWLGAGHDVTELQGLLIPSGDLPIVLAPRPGAKDIASRDELPPTTDRDLASAWLDQGAHVAYLPPLDSWTAFLDGRWQQDPSGAVARVSLSTYLAEVAVKYRDGAKGQSEEKAAQAIYADLNSTTKLRAVQAGAEALQKAHARDEDFDRDPWLFNCSNGTLDLRTGTLRDHDPADKLRGTSHTFWDPHAQAPAFDRFLTEVLPDPEVRAYLQIIMGLALVGEPVLHILPVFVGSGRNGKGTLVHALTSVFGTDYSGPVDKSLLISNKFESHPTKLMALKGKRFVTASETEQGDRFASASLKALTGGDAITARGMRENQQSFMPSHSMVLMTNSLPEVDALDKAMWDRLKLITFSADFSGREDRTLGDRLRAERSGILNWLLEGVRRYLAHGLGDEPLGVVMATGDWRMDENSFLQFANEGLVRDPKGVVPSGDLIDAYSRWCQTQDVEALKGRALGAALKAYGATEKRTRTQRQWTGIRFKGDGSGSSVTDSGDGSRETRLDPPPPVTCGDASSNDGVTHVTHNIGVSSSSTHSTSLPSGASDGGEKPVISVTSVTQPSDQQKQGAGTPQVSVTQLPKVPSPGWDRPMPCL